MDAAPQPVRATASIGARRFYVEQYHYLGNPGAYQTYLLAHNDAGVGEVSVGPVLAHGSSVSTEDDSASTEALRALDEARAGTVVNTFGVFPPLDSEMDHVWRWPGVDLDFVRTLHSD
jgi:hypothetical protein